LTVNDICLGLLQLAQVLLRIGSECGPLKATDIMPSRKLVREEIIRLSNKAICDVKTAIERPLEMRRVSFTTDLWTDKMTSIHYLDLSIVWIDDDFQIHRQNLFCQVILLQNYVARQGFFGRFCPFTTFS
jgi:hypothetical protein